MSIFLSQIAILLQSGDEEDTFWTQMLVLVVLGALVGLGYLIKTRPGRHKDQRQYRFAGTHYAGGQLHRQISRLKDSTNKYLSSLAKTAKQTFTSEENISARGTADATERERLKRPFGRDTEKNLTGGMELLEPDFLLSVVENTNGDSEKDVIMRRLSFNELLRRKKLDEVSSNALKVYTIDEGNLYGKEIQCGAMKELSQRTASRSKT